MVHETLKEAYAEALTTAEGYQSDMRIPIFKNNDGTFETGKAQHFQWSDIGVNEIGSVDGWIFEDNEDDDSSRDVQLKETINSFAEEGYQLFLEQFGINN